MQEQEEEEGEIVIVVIKMSIWSSEKRLHIFENK